MRCNRLFQKYELETADYVDFAARYNFHLPFPPLGLRVWETWAAFEGLPICADSMILDVGSFYSGTPFLLAASGGITVALENYQWPEERDIPGYQLTVRQWENLCVQNRVLPMRGDARRMPMFSDQTFDYVFCISAIEHIEDFQVALDEMRRVGKNVIITTDCSPAGQPYQNYGRYFSFAELLKHFDSTIDTESYDMLTEDRTLAVIRYG